MKRTLSLIISIFTICGILSAQDSRERTLETIVQDVLAALPAENQTEFNTNMHDLAKSAPASVVYLASRLQPVEAGVNNLVEYAISGVVRYATAPESASLKDGVRNGLEKALETCKDDNHRQFLESQLRLMKPYSAAPVVFNASEGKGSNVRCAELWALTDGKGEKSEKKILAALRSDDRAVRTTALLAYEAYADDDFYAKVAKIYRKLSPEAKADVIYWLGKKDVQSQIPLVLSEMEAGGELGSNAIEAAGRLGGSEAADKLVAMVGGPRSSEALAALKYIDSDITALVQEGLKKADVDRLNGLMKLASDKHMCGAAPMVLEYAASKDADLASKAAAALAGVVSASDFPAVASLYDSSESEKEALKKAISSSLATLPADERFDLVMNHIAKASHPESFYIVLAETGSDKATDYLLARHAEGSGPASDALLTIRSMKVAPVLLEASSDNQTCLKTFADIVSEQVSEDNRKCEEYSKALDRAVDPAVKNHILVLLGKIPSSRAFSMAGSYLDLPETSYAAAWAVKTIASKGVDDIDYYELTKVLGKAADVLKSTGNADDGYAVDEIKGILEAAKPYELSKLTEEEAAQGFEMLFDGSDLSKWTGDKVGYRVANGCINVTASYGNSGNLYTEKEYSDFIFRFEFCFTRGGVNNGVGIRTPMGVDAAYHGMEIQVLDHDDPIYADLRDYQVHGSVYGIIPAKRLVHKPLGEWSYEEIRVKGDRVTVIVNGEVIVDGNIREACQGHNVAPDGSKKNPYTVDGKNHPGLFNKKGHIGFLGHGEGLKYRNVRVLDLSK